MKNKLLLHQLTLIAWHCSTAKVRYSAARNTLSGVLHILTCKLALLINTDYKKLCLGLLVYHQPEANIMHHKLDWRHGYFLQFVSEIYLCVMIPYCMIICFALMYSVHFTQYKKTNYQVQTEGSSVPQWQHVEMPVNRSSDRSCTNSTIRNKIGVINPGCPYPSIVLQCKFVT